MASILIIGATGHLGAPMTTAIRAAYPDLPISVFVRSAAYDEEFANLNLKLIRGSFTDKELLIDASSKHSIVINAAKSTDTELTDTILQGVKKGKGTIIHVSGTANFVDGSTSGNAVPMGRYYSDANKEDIKNINPKALNGGPDTTLLAASAAGDIRAFIVAPVGVHGTAPSKISSPSKGVIVEYMTDNIAQLGYSPYLGEGSAVFAMIHLSDLVDLMLLVLDKALKTTENDPYGQYYIAKAEEHSWKEVAEMFGKAMHRNGKIVSPDAKSVPPDQAGFMAGFLGANILVNNDNAKALGLKPKGPTIYRSLEELKL